MAQNQNRSVADSAIQNLITAVTALQKQNTVVSEAREEESGSTAGYLRSCFPTIPATRAPLPIPAQQEQPHHQQQQQTSSYFDSGNGINNSISGPDRVMPSCFVNPFQGKKRIRYRKRGATSLPTASPAAKVSVEKNKTYLKDVILLPSPKVTYVPKGHAREDLFLNGFVISGYVLNSSDTEIVIKENLEKEFREIFNCMESVLKFEFVRAVEKKVVTLKTVGEKNGKTIYHVAGCRDRPIYIRAMEDVRYLLSSKELFPSGSDDDSEDGFDISIHQSKEALENKSVSNQKSFDCSMPSSSSIPVDDFAHYKLQVHHAAEIPSEHLEEETTKKEECPVCHKLFSKVLILGHVDLCIDRNCSPDPCPSSLEEELLLVRKTFIDQDHIDFIVRLRHCFSDTMKKMRLLFKDGLLRPISVEFVGNSAVDGGGPCRELFTNCFDSAKDFLLNGPEKNYTLYNMMPTK